MGWLESQVETMQAQKKHILSEIDWLERQKRKIEATHGLDKLEQHLQDFVDNFKNLSRTQERNLIDRIFERIIIRSGNVLELRIFGEPPTGIRRTKSSDSELNGRGGQIRTGDHLLPKQVR